jgi:hypothetical protein
MAASSFQERVFSTGGNVMTVNRAGLGDDIFESTVLMRHNPALFRELIEKARSEARANVASVEHTSAATHDQHAFSVEAAAARSVQGEGAAANEFLAYWGGMTAQAEWIKIQIIILWLLPKVPPHGTSPAPRAIHVTSGTLVFAFARAYSSGIATVIVPQNMRPAIISPHAYLARNNLDFMAAAESTAPRHVR